MSFERRSYPKVSKRDKHECPLPKLRWLPLLVWPRWREGAQWRCGYNLSADQFPMWINGCGALYEWQYLQDVIFSPYTDDSGYRWVRLTEG